MACTDPCSCCHGACCTGGVCTLTDCFSCEEGGGEWQGKGEPCDPDPCEVCPEGETCYICCCCDDGVDVTCYSLDYTSADTSNRDECVTGVQAPAFGNLFGDPDNCTFSYTYGECEAPPP